MIGCKVKEGTTNFQENLTTNLTFKSDMTSAGIKQYRSGLTVYNP